MLEEKAGDQSLTRQVNFQDFVDHLFVLLYIQTYEDSKIKYS